MLWNCETHSYICYTYDTHMYEATCLFSVESLPSRLTTGISNPKNGDVMYELDSQSAHPKVSNPGT